MVISAGILMYRFNLDLEVFLAHPGGPFYKKKDDGQWSVPKGQVEKDEELIDAAIREFQEETSIQIESTSQLIFLGDVIQKSGKRVYVWAYLNDFRGQIKSNVVNHPQFGKFPEIDKAEYFNLETAKIKILESQRPFLERLETKLKQQV